LAMLVHADINQAPANLALTMAVEDHQQRISGSDQWISIDARQRFLGN
jgi:hypothetical protein